MPRRKPKPLPPVEQHLFLPDANGITCVVCGLPANNRRHVK